MFTLVLFCITKYINRHCEFGLIKVNDIIQAVAYHLVIRKQLSFSKLSSVYQAFNYCWWWFTVLLELSDKLCCAVSCVPD